MIVYNKMRPLLKEKGLMFIDLERRLGLSSTIVAKFQKNRTVTTETINKVCAFLKCQPGDIMEYVEDENKAKEAELLAQIAELQNQLDKLKK